MKKLLSGCDLSNASISKPIPVKPLLNETFTFSNTWFRLIVQTAMTEYLKTEKVPVSVHLPLVEPPTIPYRQRKAEGRKPAEGSPGPARSCSPLLDTCQKFTSTIRCILGSYYCLVLLRYCIAFAKDSHCLYSDF